MLGDGLERDERHQLHPGSSQNCAAHAVVVADGLVAAASPGTNWRIMLALREALGHLDDRAVAHAERDRALLELRAVTGIDPHDARTRRRPGPRSSARPGRPVTVPMSIAELAPGGPANTT